jgi:hypothetical protein
MNAETDNNNFDSHRFFGFNEDSIKEYVRIWNGFCTFFRQTIFRQKIAKLPKISASKDIGSTEHPLELPPLTPRTDVSSTYEYKGDNVELYDQPNTPQDPFDVEYGKKDGVHVYSVKTLYGA